MKGVSLGGCVITKGNRPFEYIIDGKFQAVSGIYSTIAIHDDSTVNIVNMADTSEAEPLDEALLNNNVSLIKVYNMGSINIYKVINPSNFKMPKFMGHK